MKRILLFLLMIGITVPAFAWGGNMQGKIKYGSTWKNDASNYEAQQRAGFGRFPQGLTFYKDFTKIPAGTHTDTKYLNADYSIGSPSATFTSTNSRFTITSAGYQATTANNEVLKYLISQNRTAAQETIVIKFTPTGDFANDGVERYLTITDTKSRQLNKAATGTAPTFRPNLNDNSTVTAASATIPLDGTSYTYILLCDSDNNPGITAALYVNGVIGATTNTNNFTANAWGSTFSIGCQGSSNNQLNGYISKIAFFNRALSASEVLALNNLM